MYMLIGYIVWLVGTVVTLGAASWRNRLYRPGHTNAVHWTKCFPHRLAVGAGITTVLSAVFTIGSYWATL